MKKAIIILNLITSKLNENKKILQSFIDYLRLFFPKNIEFFTVSFYEKDIESEEIDRKLNNLISQLIKNKFQIINIISFFIANNKLDQIIQDVLDQNKKSFSEITFSRSLLSDEVDFLKLAQNIIDLTHFDNFEYLILIPQNIQLKDNLEKVFSQLNKNNYHVSSLKEFLSKKFSLEDLKEDKKTLVIPLILEKELENNMDLFLTNLDKKDYIYIPINLGEIKLFQELFIDKLIQSMKTQ